LGLGKNAAPGTSNLPHSGQVTRAGRSALELPRGWKIFRTDGDELVATLVPYGTPVK
jgi:hypothetical protein